MALRVLRELDERGGEADPLQQQALARWSGWGSVPAVFDDRVPRYAEQREQLRTLLGEDGWAAARRNTLNAHYTDAALVQAIWDVAAEAGFERGRVLEPGCGSGTFIGLAPAGCDVVGVELEPVTARVARALYPGADIRTESFADSRLPEGSFDLAIGNVPFGSYALHDRLHNAGGHSIHNHFLIKSLHLTRPGGLVLALTSRYTLDATNPGARREMAELADLVGAVRLPGGAHDRAAGTQVVTDLLLLRRRGADESASGSAWELSRPHETGPSVNEYFLDHPEQVLGQVGVGRSAYRDDELTVAMTGDVDDVAAAIRNRLGDVARRAAASGHGYSAATRPGAERPAALVEPSSRDPEGYIRRHDDGSLTQVVAGVAEPHTPPVSQRAELGRLLQLRDAVVAVLEREAASVDDSPALDDLRTQLNATYDDYVARHGPLNRFSWRRTGRVDAVSGEDRLARIRPPMGGFRADTFAPAVFALEQFDAHTQTAVKADIFHQRVVVPRRPPLGVDSPADALAVVVDRRGHVDLADVARLLGSDEEQARAQLGALVFDDPRRPGVLVPAPEYLSGNVRTKLAAAAAAAEADPRFRVNVASLTTVLPRDLGPAEIDARLGSAWIDAGDVQAFLRETLEDPYLTVEHPGGAMWSVKGSAHTVLAREVWGTTDAPAPHLAALILEQRPVQVFAEDEDGRRYLNLGATVAAQEKARELNERFGAWAWEDPVRAERLTRTYNERFNSLVLRSYDDAHLTLPGLATTFTPRPHQHAAVARIINEPATLLAHEVGAGKTAEMIMGAMELRRLGLATKPAIVVPNHMLEQFTADFLALYPRAKVLAASAEDLAGDRRRAFVARVATGDWDAVVMTRSAFERIPMSPEAQATYLAQESGRLRAWLEKGEGLSSRTVKRLEKRIVQHEEKLQARLDGARDVGVTFEMTGVDYLFVDEAHGYKNLRTPSNIPGAAIDGSMRASDLDMKLAYLRDRAGDGGRYVTFATATPISNTVTEAHVMLRYLRPDLLEAAGVDEFDAWAATFGEVVTEVELSPDGGSFRQNTRFARFTNVPELLRLFHIPADVKTAEDLQLPTPDLRGGSPETVVVPPTPEQREFIAELGDRADKVRSRGVDPTVDNMLTISSDGRMAALDLRLVGRQPSGDTKVTVAADTIAGIWAAHKDDLFPRRDGTWHETPGALQIVFCDLGTPGSQRWSVYDELRRQLVDRGLPAEQVRFVHEARTDREKAELFAACRSGQVAVLVGSTERMGVGTNVQNRAIALHHLDCPWKPAEVQQREGRIMRQGNLNPEVRILRYVTEGSFDGYSWQTVARKGAFIDQIMRGRLDVREIEDIGEGTLSYQEVKALAAGNPLLLDKARADADLARLERLDRAWRQSQASLARAVSSGTQQVADLGQRLGVLRAALPRRQDTSGDRFTMAIGPRSHDSRADAGQHLVGVLRELAAMPSGRTTPLGQLAGFAVDAETVRALGGGREVRLTFPGLPADVGDVRVGPEDLAGPGLGIVRRLENTLDLPKHIQREESRLAGTQAEIARAQRSIVADFPQRDSLLQARDRVARLAEALYGPVNEAESQTAPDRDQLSPTHSPRTPGIADGGGPSSRLSTEGGSASPAVSGGELTPVEYARLRIAVEDHAGRYRQFDPARYVAEGHLAELVDRHGLPQIAEAVAREIAAQPQVLDHAFTTAELQERAAARRAATSPLGQQATAAVAAGDADRALALVDQAELLDPDGRDWGRVRENLRRPGSSSRSSAEAPGEVGSTGSKPGAAAYGVSRSGAARSAAENFPRASPQRPSPPSPTPPVVPGTSTGTRRPSRGR